MDSAAKKVSIAIIVVLVGVIGALWYVGDKKNAQLKIAQDDLSPSTGQNIDLDPKIRAEYAVSDQEMQNLISAVDQSTSEQIETPIRAYEEIYTTGKIKVTTDEGAVNLSNYGLQVADALKGLGTNKENAAELALAATAGGDSSAVSKLKNLGQIFSATERQMAIIRVPQSAAPIHLRILNSLNKLAGMLSAMSDMTGNPEALLMTSSLYQLSIPGLYTNLNDLNKYFIDRNIKFDRSSQVKI